MGLLKAMLKALRWLLITLFGQMQWQPPAWLRAIGRALWRVFGGPLSWLRQRPALLTVLVLAVLLAGPAGWGAWRWHKLHPTVHALAKPAASVPQNVALRLEAPAVTCYGCDDPAQRAPRPLTLHFGGSIAPLALVGKELSAKDDSIRLKPAQPGVWKWQDDKTLVFTPSQDWPVGGHFDIAIAQEGFALKGVTLEKYDAEFDAPAFVLSGEGDFVQDPVNAAQKTAQFLLHFSHPVDDDSLRGRLRLAYVDLPEDGSQSELTPPAYTLAIDATHLNATLHTANLPLPINSGRLDLIVDSGLGSKLGGAADKAGLQLHVAVPGRGALKVNELVAAIARDADDSPVQTLTMTLSQSTTEDEVKSKVQAWLLPLKHPNAGKQRRFERAEKGNADKPYPWDAGTAAAFLKDAEALPLVYNPLEAEHSDTHSFRDSAEPGRYLFLRVNKGMKSFGGYELESNYDTVVRAPDYAPELRLLHSGALLAMSGQKKLAVFTRDLPGVRIEIGRLLPNQIQHLVTQSSGRLDHFSWQSDSFNENNITEHFTQDLTLPKLKHGQAHYEPLDLSAYLAQGQETRRGIFILRLSGYDPVAKKVIDSGNNRDKQDCEDCAGDDSNNYDYGASTEDTRLVVVTDLGLVSKRNKDGSQDVFVQSIASGEPVAGVNIDVIATNGAAVLGRSTDADGHAHLPELKGFERERAPVLLLARKGGDESFLPLNDDRGGDLDLSRFDVGGVSQAVEPGALSAYFFTDRGIYRPGEQAHLGVIVKATDFDHALPQTPVDYEITDPQGAVAYKVRQTLPATGFDELSFTTSPAAPSGNYTVTAWLPGAKTGDDDADKDRRRIGSLDFKVREFEPDRLKIHMTLKASRTVGWVKPEALDGAHVDLQNLFGTPAQNRRVTAQMKLTPWLPSFEGYGDYQFTDPQLAKEGVTLDLNEAKTDDNGQADLAIDLKPYAATSYWLHLITQGFEPDGGRGVTAEAGQVVSSLPYLIGWKAEDPLYWVAQGATPRVSLLAVDPEVKHTAAGGLKLRRYAREWVSVLVRNDRGYYYYDSRQKEKLLSETKLDIPAEGTELTLDTGTPGAYLYNVADADDRVFASIPYEVSGNGNVTRSLEKNAELKLTLSKKDYAPGEEVEVSLVAPYAGAGLITIEREKVLAWKWFKAKTTASVQKIKLPDGLEGSAYVHVMFTRDPGSEDVYSTPLSYGVAPFSVAIDARRAALTLDAPAKIKPGEVLNLKLSAARPGRAVAYAVDEGILQVARYKTPDPLGFYYQKRSLDVHTLQILDLILPEFGRGMPQGAAPGGDADAALGKHLNPFRRKTDPPIAWWSGLVDVGPQPKELQWTVPDSFNGALRLVALSVAPEAIGVAEGKTLVRGDFTLLPNAPLAVTPGDEFEVSTGISNNLESAPKDAPIQITLTPSANLEVLGPATQTVPVSALHEGVARYRVRAKDTLGGAELGFAAAYGGSSAKVHSTLSVRPAMPMSPNLSVAMVQPGASLDMQVLHATDFYPQFRRVEASASTLPLVMAHGLNAYLGGYGYKCTEQLMSMAVPALVLSSRPEFGTVQTEGGSGGFAGLFAELALRQRPEGDFSLWSHGGYSVEPVSIYTQHFLIEAADRGFAVPPGMIESGNRFLTEVARREGKTYWDDRDAAYAIYLLTRQGEVMSNEADALVKRLDKRDKGWRHDTPALWLGAAYARMQQKRVSDELVNNVIADSQSGYRSYAYDHGFYYYDSMASDAELLYMLAKHFPEQLVKYGPILAKDLADGINQGGYYSYASGATLLALDAYATVAGKDEGKLRLDEVAADGSAKPLTLPAQAMPKLSLSAGAAKLRVSNDGTLPVFGVLAELGFPRHPPKAAESHGIEVLHEFVDEAGHTVSKAVLGQQLTVRLSLRAIDRAAINSVALVDLLPGGFEIVQPPTVTPEQTMDQATPDAAPADQDQSDQSAQGDADQADAGTDADAAGKQHHCDCDWVKIEKGQLDFAEPREDRAVFYADASRDVQVYTYRIKAVTAGTFVVPPAYGEAMYDRTVYAYSLGGSMEVDKP